ncbi:RNA polymerase sigma-70 factor (ECF subfamily) [Aquimarina sp. EL_43]|uniref:RNA polymerase sigma factor n=1 Tax=Aquimarina TaxID=290174 RepID=UPI00046F99CC|nr:MULTISPECIES: RNA polymerase sigma factor [Aquimarina]MBG6128961.1 RNA polymerase sigma-70 factor (ECF subfamily) [Aquimarina sp. EL_35]MBG6150025.1 RNA polymerase sigma-70 factor (ECF subfamily) [Aquimarina sp. EL_32]MBG6167288.1 RNA polymerase sigma-70 factor (ECF subfamily) [Aquimarina sp. EL_43]
MKKTELDENLEDKELVYKIAKSKDTKLYAILYDRYAKTIYNKCLSFVKSNEEAQDLTHDIFVLLFAKLKTFKGNSKFSTWLYSFTYNFCVNYVQRVQKKKKEKIISIDNIIVEYPSEEIDDEDMMKLKSKKLAMALKKIEPDDKIILMMKYQDDLSIKEIEKALNIGSSAVKMRLSRAKSRLVSSYKTL